MKKTPPLSLRIWRSLSSLLRFGATPFLLWRAGKGKEERGRLGERRGEATMAEIRGGFAVASVAEILRLDPTSDPLGMGRVRVEIEQAVGDDLEQQFQAALRVRANVRINERVLEQVTGR